MRSATRASWENGQSVEGRKGVFSSLDAAAIWKEQGKSDFIIKKPQQDLMNVNFPEKWLAGLGPPYSRQA